MIKHKGHGKDTNEHGEVFESQGQYLASERKGEPALLPPATRTRSKDISRDKDKKEDIENKDTDSEKDAKRSKSDRSQKDESREDRSKSDTTKSDKSKIDDSQNDSVKSSQSPHADKSKDSPDDSDMKGHLFKGLKFFFVPTKNNSVIKQRSQLFERYGAQILKEFDESARQTLLVQKGWDGRKVAEYVKLDIIPKTIDVIRDSWPSDCIDKKKLVEKNLPIYIVPSVPRTAKHEGQDNEGDKENGRHLSQKRASAPPRTPSPAAKKQKSHSFSSSMHSGRRPPESDETIVKNLDELDRLMEDSRLEAKAEEMISEYEEGTDKGFEAVPKKYRKGPNFNAFACMQAVAGDENNPNRHTMMLLSMLQNHYENLGDQFRAISYRKAIISLRHQKKLIRTAKEAVKINGIGDSIAHKIEEAVNTGTIRKLENAKKEQRPRVIGTLLNIYGVGPRIADKWYKQGVRSLEDVAKRGDLTGNQRVGLEHYEDFLERMPRDLATKYYERAIESLKKIDPKAETYCMGSHRRGQMDCGDIDIILTKKGAHFSELQEIMEEWLTALYKENFAKHTFGGGTKADTRWLGAVAFDDDKWRRLDILVVPEGSLGAALIYYTGNATFNRSIRLLASRKGYHLNGDGLFKAKKGDEKKATELVEARDEKKIFDILGVPYRLPTDRNIG